VNRTLKPRSSRSEIRTDITFRSVRSLRLTRRCSCRALAGASWAAPPDLAPSQCALAGSLHRPFNRERIAEFDYSIVSRASRKLIDSSVGLVPTR